ncbi:DUF2281 domain-containing protein [Methylomagnum sp.]
MNSTNLIHDLSSLPPEAQQEVVDFVAFLKARYPTPKVKRATDFGKLEDDPFIGMWENREDMQDSTAWVRDLRRKEWCPKL